MEYSGDNALTAEQSDPRVMGWMTGFPPPPDKLITQPESIYFSFPRLRWSVCHMRELLPTREVSRGLRDPLPLAYASGADLSAFAAAVGGLTFTPIGASKTMTWEASLFANYTDGVIIFHRNRVIYERYFGALSEQDVHACMSMTKSLTGLLAQILISEKRLDEEAPVESIIPEIKNSGFRGATVRDVMDMTTDVAYTEDYADPNSDVWTYAAAASPLPKPEGYTGPDGYWEYLQQVRGGGRHGSAFHYRTINADMLGWIVSRAANLSVADLASQKLWRPMGAELAAYMTVDAKGVPFAGGGLSAGLRDLGRLGLLLLNEGMLNGTRVFSPDVVRRIRDGGDKSKFGTQYPALVGGSYSSMWWNYPGDDGVFAARGVHGQTIYVDPSADMVIVRLASFPRPENPLIDPTTLPAFQAVSRFLRAHAP